ncbi:MAG TPA: hypothetical protein VJN39_01380 [Gemmatimonadales bacterium]|nr:hypothetical protein [Gemmatimonadales bacterium]
MSASDAARRAGLTVWGVALISGALALNRDLVGVFYDDGIYASLGWALGHGIGYVHPHLPGAPAAVHFPPLYPLVLAPLFGTVSVQTAAFAGKVLNVILAAIAAGLIAWHATRSELLGAGTPRWLPGVVVGAAAIAIPVLTVLTTLLSEPLFALLLALAVILADRPPERLAPTHAALLAGLAAALALLARSIGVAAGAGVVGFLLFVRRVGRAAAGYAALPVAVAAVAWAAWVLRHAHIIDPALRADYGTYGDVLTQSGLSALGASTLDLPRPLGVLTLGWVIAFGDYYRYLYYLFGIPALAVGVYGLRLLLSRSAIGPTLAGYLAILAVWPVPPDRFLWAVLPWIALAWVAGAVALWRQQRLRVAVALLALALGLGYARYEARGFAGRWWSLAAHQISANMDELLPWIETLPSSAVLATDDESLIWLYTRRTAVPLYLFSYRGREEAPISPAAQLAFLERTGVTHVLVTGPGPGAAELDALVRAAPSRFRLVRRWPGGRAAFEVTRES